MKFGHCQVFLILKGKSSILKGKSSILVSVKLQVITYKDSYRENTRVRFGDIVSYRINCHFYPE